MVFIEFKNKLIGKSPAGWHPVLPAVVLILLLISSGCLGPREVIPDGPGLNGSPVSGGRALEGVGNGLSNRLLPKAPVQQILALAFSKTGLPYRSGGTSPETGFDCSGFTQWVFGENGIPLPRTPRDQLDFGQPVDKDQLQPGDLVFYDHRYLHVGIYTGDGKFIHSPHTGDRVKESEAFDRYHTQHFAGARRVITATDATPLNPELKEIIVAKALNQHGQPSAAVEEKVKTTAVIRTVSTAPPKKSTKSPATATIQYTVKKGDTIWTVARHFGVSKNSLLRANGLKENHTLRIGQKLTVPKS